MTLGWRSVGALAIVWRILPMLLARAYADRQTEDKLTVAAKIVVADPIPLCQRRTANAAEEKRDMKDLPRCAGESENNEDPAADVSTTGLSKEKRPASCLHHGSRMHSHSRRACSSCRRCRRLCRLCPCRPCLPICSRHGSVGRAGSDYVMESVRDDALWKTLAKKPCLPVLLTSFCTWTNSVISALASALSIFLSSAPCGGRQWRLAAETICDDVALDGFCHDPDHGPDRGHDHGLRDCGDETLRSSWTGCPADCREETWTCAQTRVLETAGDAVSALAAEMYPVVSVSSSQPSNPRGNGLDSGWTPSSTACDSLAPCRATDSGSSATSPPAPPPRAGDDAARLSCWTCPSRASPVAHGLDSALETRPACSAPATAIWAVDARGLGRDHCSWAGVRRASWRLPWPFPAHGLCLCRPPSRVALQRAMATCADVSLLDQLYLDLDLCGRRRRGSICLSLQHLAVRSVSEACQSLMESFP